MPALLADIGADGFDVGIRTNVHGTFSGLKHQIPAMIATGAERASTSPRSRASSPAAT